MFEVTTKHSISARRVADLFVTAFEGGSAYWLHIARLKKSEFKTEDHTWYDDVKVFEGTFQIFVKYDDPNGEEGNGKAEKVITRLSVRRGLEKMANEHPTHFNDFIEENGDATTADVFMQLVIMGDVIYG